MELSNLVIDRIIIHQIFKRGDDAQKIEPLRSHDFTRFNEAAMDAFKSRVREALGGGSKAVEMEIVNHSATDLPSIIDELVDMDDEAFAVASYDVAKKLNDAQSRKAIPGGIVVVFSGRQGRPVRKFVGIIKAEIHSAYEKEVDEKTKEISLKFVEEVLLTPGTKLYKTAGFFEKADVDALSEDLNSRWVVMVSDNQISQADGKAAAQYFYSGFLGCGYPQSSARTTRQFYEAASDFINDLNVSVSEKNDLHNALTTYLKVSNSSTVSCSDFAFQYFDLDTQDIFCEHMSEVGIPNIAFTKDTAQIDGKLKFRKISFGGNVKITAPSESFKKLVVIETIDGEPDEAGNPTEWTRVTIKEKVVEQQ